MLVSRDIRDFYPSCNTEKCLEAVKVLLDSREKQNPSSECILEALEITMSSNSTEFDSRFFTQIDGATNGSPDSGSVTDIFGAIHIDKVIQDHCPIEPENYRRYRDDTFDVCLKSSEEDQKLVTNWMNENIYQDKIKFTANYDREKMVFLDTELTLREATVNNERGFYLIPQMYSKDTDTHQYLHPSSCHSPHIAKDLPTSIINRIRRNCSDKVDNDEIFKETMIEYKAYMLKSGYDEELIDDCFITHAIETKRKDLLQNRKRKKPRKVEKYRMVTNYEPTFPDIRKGFSKFRNIFEEDKGLQEIFPKGIVHLQVSERHGAKNIKELIAPSTVKFKEENNAEQVTENSEEVLKGSYPCRKQCAYCQLFSKSQGQTFQSNSNRKIFKVRQHITCKSRNIIYLVTCIKCKLQGVGHSTHFEKRISNYFSHIRKERMTVRYLLISLNIMGIHGYQIMAGIQTLK